MNVGVYSIINVITGEMYIGQSSNLSRRQRAHFYELRHNQHYNGHLQKAFNKYGSENFTFSVIVYCEKSELTHYEQSLVDIRNGLYNLKRECVNSALGISPSEETRKKLSDALMGRKIGPMTEEAKRKLSDTKTGRKHSPETIEKMRAAAQARKGANLNLPKRRLSEETKQKMSQSATGKKRPYTDEHRRNMSEAIKKAHENRPLFGRD